MGKWIKTAARLVWESIGGKLAILPIVAATIVSRLKLVPGQEIVAGDFEIQVSWVVAAAIIVSWLIGGLLIKAVKLQRAADLDPQPDMSGREAFQHIVLHSKWALGRNPDRGNLYQDVDREIGGSARLGRLKVWGELTPSMKGGFPVRLREFPAEEWAHLHFDYPSCVSNSPEGARITDYSGNDWIYYENVEMCREQIFNLWPKANWFERRRDKARQNRLDFLKKEQESYVTR